MTETANNTKAPMGKLAGWLAGPACLAAAAGMVPTWRLAGQGGLHAMAAAGVAVFVGMFLSSLLVVWRTGLRPEQLAARLVGSMLIRVSICLSAAAGAWYIFSLPTSALFVWTVVFYLVMLVGESFWLARTLRRTPTSSGPRAGDGGL